MNKVLPTSVLGLSRPSPDRSGLDLASIVRAEEEKKFSLLPSVATAAEEVISIIESEERSSEIINTRHLVMQEDGSMPAIDGALFSEGGFKKFMTILSGGGAGFLIKQDPDIRAVVMNRLMENREKPVKLHTRTNTWGDREIFSVTGENFPDESGSIDVLSRLVEAAPEKTKANWSYNSDKATVTFEALIPTMDETYRVGDPHNVGVKWLIRDAGWGAISPSFAAWRHACANMQILSTDEFALPRTIHRGSMEVIRKRLTDSFEQATQMLQSFNSYWNLASKHGTEVPGIGFASKIKYLSNDTSEEESFKLYSKVMYHRLASKIPDLLLGSVSKTVNTLTRGFLEEPEYSWRGLINGITSVARDSHENSTKRNNLEKVAGDLLVKMRPSAYPLIGNNMRDGEFGLLNIQPPNTEASGG